MFVFQSNHQHIPNREYSWDCIGRLEQKTEETNTVEPILCSKNSVELNIVDINMIGAINKLILDLKL